MNQRKEKAKGESDAKKQAQSTAQKRQAFLEEYVKKPLEQVAAPFVSEGFKSDIRRGDADVTARIDGTVYRVAVEFRNGSPSGYAMDGASGPIHDPKEFAEMVKSAFLTHLRRVLK